MRSCRTTAQLGGICWTRRGERGRTSNTEESFSSSFPVWVQFKAAQGPGLARPHLSGVGGEEQHDGEARQQAGVLDGEREEEAASSRLLFLPTHLVHLGELTERSKR